MNNTTVIVASRIMMSLVFILSGVNKLMAPAAAQAYMAAQHVPPILVWPTLALEIGGGLALVFGIRLKLVAPALAIFSLAAAALFHNNLADQTQMIMLLKNIAMAGGLLAIAANARN